MGSIDDEIRAELEKEKAAKSQELNQGPATEPAIEQANKPTPVASPKSPAVTSLDSEILAEIKAEKKAPAASEPEEPQYITKFRQYGPDKDDEDIRTSIELLNPEERNNLLKSQPWVYNKMTPEQQEQEFQLSRKSHPFSAGELIGGIGSIIGTGVDLAKSAAELGMDIADVRISAPIRQAIENKSWFEVKGRNDQIQKAQDKLDQDARNLASSVPAGIINTTRTVQKIFGGKDLNGISNNIQRAIATAAPILGQQIGVPIGVTQNIVGAPMPLQAGEKPNPWSMVPQTGYIPFDLVTKLAEATYNKDVGGFAALDRLNEFLGLSDEEQSRNHDHIRRLYDAEVGAEDWKASVGEKKLSPWSQVAFSDIGQQAILLREKSMLPSAQFIADVDGTSIEEAEEKRERIAEANAEKATIELTKKWNKEYDPSMEFLGSLFIGDAGFGEAGLALGAGKLASPLIQKAKTLGMTDKEVSTYYAALQKLEKAKDIARQKKMSQPSWWGKSAGYVEQKQKDLSAAGQSLFERLPAPVQAAAPIAGKIATKVGLGGVGGGVGALLDPENPTAGLLEGITLTTALGTAPSIIRSIDTARRTIGAGEGKLFTQVAKSPESSLPARLIFNKATGPVIDYIAENGITLAKAGVNLGALSAITSTLNSDDPEDFNRAIAEGFGMGMGFHLAHGFAGKFHGKNPAQELKDRKKRDIEIHEAVKTASPATQGVLEQVTNYQTAIDRVDAFVARNERNLAEAIAKEDQKWIEMATTALKNSRALQREVLRANVQTRNEYGRSFLSTYADMNRLANGTRRAGQPNISIEILTPEQIVDLHVSENSRQGMTPDEIMAVRAQGESYAMEQGFFDRAKNRAVINAGHVLARTTLFGESPSDALRHEASHALDEIPEFKKLNEKTDRLLFTNEEKDLQGNVLKRTEGIYDDKALVEMYLNKYIGERNAEEKIAFSEQLGLWNRDTQSLNVPEVVKYMKAEVRAELTAGNLRSGLGKLMGAEATIANWIGMRQKQNFLARAIQSVTGLGAKPFGSELLNIEYTPEVIAANREAIKALNEFNGRFEANPEGFSGREMSEKEIRTNPVLRKRYGLNGGEFQTELKGVIRDANGKIVGKPVTIANPFAAEGNWSFDAEGNRKQTRGYGQVPDEFQGAQIPAGGSLEVYRDFVYEPDGKTPVRTKPSDLAKLEKDRGDLIRQALTDAAYDDSTTRLTPFSADGLSWSGIMSKSQVQAIKDIPESILPLSIKEKILAFNDSMARGDGSTFDIDYAPRLGRGKAYKGRKSDIYHIIPIGFGFSKAGNFYLRTLSLNAAFRKLKARAKLMQGWLEPWDNDPNLFMKEFQETYLNNTYEKRDGWLGLDPENPTQKTPLAEVKFGRFLDFMNMIGAETPPNPQRAATPADPSARGRKKSKLGLEEDNQGIDNLWRSHRLDAIADIADTTEQTGRYRMDLDRVYKALMPAEPAPEAPMEERRPSAINLGISATYTPERKPFEARYVAPEGAALTASLVASGTSLESFGKESLAKLAEYYGITIPDGASRGEIIDSINERQPSAKISFMPAEEKYPTGERGFYSGLQKTIDEKMPAKASPQQILSIVNNPQNAKPEEVKWSNLAGFLEGKQSVTKQEVLDYLRNEGSVKFEERTLGGKLQYNEKSEFLKKFPEIKNIYENSNNAADFRLQLDNSSTLYDELRRKGYGELADDPAFAHRIASDIFTHEPVPTKYSQYVLPNGENYREVVLTMPSQFDESKVTYTEKQEGGYQARVPNLTNYGYGDTKEAALEMLKSRIASGEFKPNTYTSSHFQETPNYVAHMRLNERPDAEGRDGLFIEEIQSDRHQQGREKGYKQDPEKIKAAQAELNAAESALTSLQNLAATTPLNTPMGEKLPEKMAQAQMRYQSAREVVNGLSGQIPEAPFRKDWSVQMFKRALRDAIASGKEWVGWTDGKTQNERFDLSKQVQKITSFRNEDGTYNIKGVDTNGDGHDFGTHSIEKLPAVVGKDLAEKIVSEKLPIGVFAGNDLKVGGEGMKGFYDQILPNEIGKYVKKWGAKVEEGKIGQSISKEEMDMGDISDATPEELAQLESQGMVSGPTVKIWKIDITPEMRESIQKGGQIAFMPKVAVVPERFTGTGAEETRRGKYVAPPKFFGQFNISQYEKGGKFFDAETGEDITDKSYENASISVDGGKPSLVANNESESMGTGPIVRSNLFKQKAGWKWISENPPETSTIVSVEGGGKHVYTLRADFQNGVKMARYPDKTSEPRLRPTGRGELVMGQEIGRIDIRGKEHPVYDMVTIGEKPASDIAFMPAAKLDETYAKAIESGDMEEAQRLVDEAAKEAGAVEENSEYLMPEEKIPASKFYSTETPNKESVQKYQEAMLLGDEFPPVIYRKEGGILFLEDGNHRVQAAYNIDPNTPVSAKEIKSAEPATYDNEGKLIPLSQRFDTSKQDIRFMPATKLDEAHAKAIESGDMEEAQRMVDERARQAGYDITAYHGSPEKGVRVLSPKKAIEVEGAVFLSSNPDVADQYRYERAYGDIIGEDAGDLVDARIKLENPYIYKPKGKIVDAIEFGKAIDYAKKNGNDGVIVNDIDDSVGMTGDMGTTYAVFNSEQIKSADPATYDNEGKLIPLSQRFDTSKSDIRFMPATKLDEAHASAIESGDMEEAQRLVDERARKAGYNTPVYHGTTTASGEITIPVGRPELGIASHVTTSRDEAEYFSRLTTEYFKEDRDSPSAEPIVKKWYYKGETFDPENNSHIQRVEDAIKDVREIQGRFKSETDDYNPETWKTKTYDFFEKNIDIIQAIKRAGFDGYKDRESIDYKWSETPNIAIFEPNNIKSADPATYDNEGKLIPLSQRFDTSKQDIRFMPAAKLDEAHAKAIESGDMKEAQRLVDERARKAGYTIGPVYHGTAATTEELTIPRGDRGVAAHVSFNKKVAKEFANSRAYDSGDDPQIHQWLIKGDIFDPTKSEHLQRLKNIIGENIDKGRPVDKIPTHADYSTFESTKLQDALKKAGFDGYYDREDNESGWDENIAIFEPNNIKSADPATYDDNGKLIPLSQRFDTSKQDIRFMPESKGEDELVGQDPDERYTGKAPAHDWRKADLQMNVPWSEKVVAEFLGVPEDQNIYKGMIDLSDLKPSVAEFEIAKEIRSGEQEVEQMYLDQAEEMLDRYTSEENVNNPFFSKNRGEFAEWSEELPWSPEDGYDESDVEVLAREMQARDQGGYDEEEYSAPRSSGYPPIVVTRKADGSLVINDGNHRVDTWQKAGYDVAPAWINDEMRRSKEQGGVQFMPYSPELPKTEDGKVDWAGFKTRTQETAKPLADLSPLGGVSFMPAKKTTVAQTGYDDTYLKKALKDGKDGKVKLTRPFRADEALPTMEQLPVIGNQVDRNIFKYNEPAEVIFYEHDGTPVSFKWDGQMLIQPEFKDIAEEHAGKAVQLAMADRQTATGGDMGGVMHTFLKSLRTITIKDPLTGNDLIVVWANNEWKPAKNMKDKVRMFGAKDLLTYLMGEDAHASNARSVRRISNEIENSGLNDKEIDTFLILANKGVKTARAAEQKKTIKDAQEVIEKAKANIKKEKDQEKKTELQNLIKLAEKSISDAEAKLPQYEITPEEKEFSDIIKNFKSSYTGFLRGTRSKDNFQKREKEFYDFLKTQTFTKLRKVIRGKSMIKLDDTFKGRKAAVQNLLGLTIKGFNIDHILPMTADFKGGRIHHIVSSVELSTNPELGAVYLGEDPEQAKFMSPLEKAAAAKIKADPNFVVHEAYAWGMLGPVNGNHFINTNPRTPEEYFPDFRKRYAATKETADKADKITNASESNLVNTMRDQKSFALTMAKKSKK